MFLISSIVIASLLDGLGEVLALPVGHGQEHGHHQRGEQLQVVGVQAQPQHHLDDDVVDDRADAPRTAASGAKLRKILPKMHLADDDGGQTDDDGAAAHVHVREALILGTAGRRPAPPDRWRASGPAPCARVGVDALGTGHVLVRAGGAQRAAQLGAEEPVQHARSAPHSEDDQQQNGVAAAPAPGHSAEETSRSYLSTLTALAWRLCRAHDPQVDGIQRQLGQDAGQNGRDAADRCGTGR